MDSGYLITAFSSVWAFCVVLLALAGGFMFPLRKKLAVILLGSGAILSLLDTGLRVAGQRSGPRRDMMIDGLPGQLAANSLFQLALPCLAGLALIGLALLAGRLVRGRSRTAA